MEKSLMFGYHAGIPSDITSAWGARLIEPNDLVHDRQDLVAESDEAKSALVAWLNGGAIEKALDWLGKREYRAVPDGEEFVVYEDEDGKIVGNTNRSFGYVYVAGWLKPDRLPLEDRAALREIRRSTPVGRAHDALTVDHYDVIRGAITVERWHTHYGWSREDAERFGDGSSEVRVFAVYGDGTRRELEGDRAGEFEFGYGGTGPHNTARAIVEDLIGFPSEWSPARLRDLVPEVFVHDSNREAAILTVSAGAVRARRAEAA
jgi:hypothetical protein